MNRTTWPLILTALATAGCHTPAPVHDWSTYRGPGEVHFQEEEVSFPSVDDPIEPFNRVVWDVNEGAVKYVLRPVGTGWRAIMPKPVRSGLGNFFTNLLFPGRVINDLLQGKGGKAWDETKRFAVNSTVGVLGFRDQASAWEIGKSQEDFGQTFAKWGWRDSTYVVLPFFGPSTTRDALGFAGDLLVDPAFYFAPASQVRNVNRNSDLVETLVSFLRTNYDPYELARLAYVLNRENDVQDYSIESEATGETDTLGVVLLKPDDPNFVRKSTTHKIVSPATGRELAYTIWPHEGDGGALVFVVPGLGGHRLGSSALAIAEAIYEYGNTPVTISSLMNSEFIEGGLSAELPGFLPSDTRDVHLFLDAVDRDVRTRHPALGAPRLVGISLGGITTLFIAAAEADPKNDLVEFEAYMAINSPVSLRHGVSKLDAFFNSPLAYPAEDREERINGIFRKTLDLAQGLLDTGEELPFTKIEAEFLIGLSFRNTIRDFIYQTQARNDMGVLKADLDTTRRVDAYREITQFSFIEYAYAFLLPYYSSRREDIAFEESGVQRLFELCDLRSIEAALAANKKIVFASNRNDFLLRPEDIDWATATFGEDRVLFFERGGHLGNLSRDDVREALRGKLMGAITGLE